MQELEESFKGCTILKVGPSGPKIVSWYLAIDTVYLKTNYVFDLMGPRSKAIRKTI